MEHAERRREWNRKQRAMFRGNGLQKFIGHQDSNRVDPDCYAARLAEIPDDTRDLTGLIFGDPLPGRRAIDRRGEV